MPTASGAKVADEDIFALTALGESQLNGAQTALSEEQLKVLVVVDGKSTAGELMRGMPVLTPAAVRDNLRTLLAGGLIRLARSGSEGIAYIDPGDFFKTIGKPVRLPAVNNATPAEPSPASPI